MYEHLMGKKLTKEDKKYFEEWILNERKLSEIEKIINLRVFEDHPELLSPNSFRRTAEEIEEIVNLEVFRDRPDLLTPSAFLKTAKEIEEIVNLEVFRDRPDLLTPSAFFKTAKEIEEIVNLEVFKDRPDLLTPSAFLKTAKEIEEIVNLEVFKDHPELLTPSAFLSAKQKILDVYGLYCLHKVERYISSSHLSLPVNEVRAKINFLDDMNLPITIETNKGKIKLHPIMLMTNKNMKLNYGITKKELVKKYTYVDADKDDYKKGKRY